MNQETEQENKKKKRFFYEFEERERREMQKESQERAGDYFAGLFDLLMTFYRHRRYFEVTCLSRFSK